MLCKLNVYTIVTSLKKKQYKHVFIFHSFQSSDTVLLNFIVVWFFFFDFVTYNNSTTHTFLDVGHDVADLA